MYAGLDNSRIIRMRFCGRKIRPILWRRGMMRIMRRSTIRIIRGHIKSMISHRDEVRYLGCPLHRLWRGGRKKSTEARRSGRLRNIWAGRASRLLLPSILSSRARPRWWWSQHRGLRLSSITHGPRRCSPPPPSRWAPQLCRAFFLGLREIRCKISDRRQTKVRTLSRESLPNSLKES